MTSTRSILASLFVVTGLAATASGCGFGSAHATGAKAPEWQPEGGQYKCKVAASRSEPLVVEWPSADRAKLEALTRSGIVAVKYNGCEMQVMGACSAKGDYRYVGTTLKRDVVRIKDADELYAKLPFGAAGLESTLQRSGQLDVNMSLVGRFAAAQPVIHEKELVGSCNGATHVISALIVGAFEFSAKGAATGKDRASVFEGNAGATAESEKQVITRDGDEASCSQAAAGDATPPQGCRALIRVEVLPLPEVEARTRDSAEAANRDYEEKRSSASTRRTIGYAVGAGGIGVGVLAGVLGIMANSKVDDIQKGGLSNSAAIEDSHSSATSLATGAWIAGGIGIAMVGAGAALVLLSKDPQAPVVQGNAGMTTYRW